MKTSSKFSSLLGLLGAVLLCGSILLCLLCAKASPLMLGTPQNALDVTEAFAQALRAGDPASAGALLSGQPRLTCLPEEDSMTVLLWDAYTSSLQIEFQEGLTVSDSGCSRNFTVTALDIPALMEQLKEAAPALLAEEAALIGEDFAFGEDNHYRQDFVTEVVYRGTETLLKNSLPTVSREFRLELVMQKNGWQILPDQPLLDLLCGKIT